MLRNRAALAVATVLMGAPVAAQAQTAPTEALAPATVPALTPADPRAVAARAAELLEAGYLDPAIGRSYAARLRARAAEGAYDGLSGRDLANRLTLDLVAVHDDAHLRVRAGAPQMAPPDQHEPQAPGRPPAIEAAGWIIPGVAFIRFNAFPAEPAVAEAALAFMQSHQDARAVIFDLRNNRGGGPMVMDAILPLLFAERTRLVAMTRREVGDGPGFDGPSLRIVDGAPGFTTSEQWVEPGPETPMWKAQVYVLTSQATGSAGEHFAAAFKWSGRGVLIGGSTAGANHLGAVEPLAGGLTLFVPGGRTFNPATGEDWEGVGVEPDIETPPEEALIVALQRLGVPEGEARTLSEQNRPTGSMTRPPLVAP